MKALVLCLTLLCGALVLSAQAPGWLWVVQAGGTGTDETQVMTADSQGNQYLTGYFTGTSVFGATTLTSRGGDDIFIAKLDPQGNWLWAKRAGGTNHDIGNFIAVDSAGYVYVTGGFFGTADFGPFTLSHTDIEHLFLAKLDANGNWQWVDEALGQDSEGMGIAFDSQDNVYLTGAFRYTVTFGTLAPLTCIGLADIFVAKVDANSNWLWATQASGTGWDVGTCIKLDNQGNIYLTGIFEGSDAFGATTLTSAGDDDIFIAKLDNAGNWLWAKRAGGSLADIGWGLALDSSLNVIVTGGFGASASFGNTSLTSAGGKDIFVARLDNNGNWLGINQVGGISDDLSFSLAVDSQDNCYITGFFNSTVSFGFIPLTAYSAFRDVFLAKMNNTGSWQWAIQAGGTNEDAGIGVAVDDAGNLYLSGWFRSAANFGSTALISNGLFDIFAAKLASGVGTDDSVQIPLSAFQMSNYPNPFNPETTIEYSVPVSGQASLKIYNLKGQLVRSLVDEVCAAGKHSAVWNGRDDRGKEVSIGVYLYRLSNGSSSSTRKMLLLK